MVRVEFAAAAALVVVLYHIGSNGACGASAAEVPYAATTGTSGAELNALGAGAAAAPLAAGETYRPPIINMSYFGGPVLWKPIRLYFIWYGTWTASEKAVIRTASNSLTPTKPIPHYPNLSNYWSVVTKYSQHLPGEPPKFATKKVTVAGEVDDNYSLGHNINGSIRSTDPYTIIHSHVGHGLPTDLEQGVYFLFTSKDVGFTEQPSYCGYHSRQCFVANSDCNDYHNHIVYSFVPVGSTVAGCNIFSGLISGPPPNSVVSPDGGLDSTVQVYLHELLELAVDPYPEVGSKSGWRMNLFENSETADMCAYSFRAGDWFYCGLSSVYPDFTGGAAHCSSIGEVGHSKVLTEPKSRTTFNVYGIDGFKFLVQQFWSLGNKGCVLQLEEAACPKSIMKLTNQKGTIHRGRFFNGVGLQRYAPGQACTWRIAVAGAKSLNLTFDRVALGYDDKDYITLTRNGVVLKKLTRFQTNVKYTVAAKAVRVNFVADGSKSPFPSSAGFIMRWQAVF